MKNKAKLKGRLPMSYQQIGRKEEEREALLAFLDAYKFTTGETLSIVESDESPDFICNRKNGNKVGIELAKVTRAPSDILCDKIISKKFEIEPYTASEYIYNLIEKKERARSNRYTLKVTENILVLQLVDGSLVQIKWVFDGLQNDFTDHGFLEIWLADYSGYGAYGDIELFGLYPMRWWGYHQRSCPERKPYG